MFCSLLKISLLSALAVVTQVTAAPVSSGKLADLKHASFGHHVALSELPSGFADLKHPRDLTDDASTPTESIPDILTSLNTQLEPISTQLRALVTGKSQDEVNVDEVTHSLESLEVLLKDAAERTKAIVSLGGLNAKIPILSLDGKEVGMLDVAKSVATLLDTLFGTLILVVRVIGSLDIPVISDLLAIIGGLVADLLTTVFGFIPGLKPLVGPLIEGTIGLLKVFDFLSLDKAIEI